MASRDKKNGGDFVLESRHLVGLFMLLVVIFGVVFTLGYLLGRSQYDAKLRAVVGTPAGIDVEAAAPAPKARVKPEPEDAAPPKKSSDWDFYHSAETPKKEDHLQPPAPAKSAASAPQPAAAPKPPSASPKVAAKSAPAASPASASGSNSGSGTDGPLIPSGKIMLQVAAVMHQDDALALAQALQQKKFPAVVLTPGADKLYRVQVGPYSDNQSAAIARQKLEAQGFKSIIKR